MTLTALLALAWTAGLASPTALKAPPGASSRFETQTEPAEKVRWFDGTLDEALAHAKAAGLPVLVDFWAAWCQPCRTMDATTFTDPLLVREMRAVLPVKIIADTDVGEELSERFSVTLLPTIVFLNSNGEPQDSLRGFLSAEELREQLARVLRGEGTVDDLRRRVAATPGDPFLRFDYLESLDRVGSTDDAALQAGELRRRFGSSAPELLGASESVELRGLLYRRFRAIGDDASAEQQLEAMRRLDPEGRSIPRKRLLLEQHISALQLTFDEQPLREFLRSETNSELLCEGWNWLATVHFSHGKRAEAQGDVQRAHKLYRAGVQAYRETWPHVSDENIAALGQQAAAHIYAARSSLSVDDLKFATSLARRAAETNGANALVVETFANCLAATAATQQERDEARTVAERARHLAESEER